MKKLLLGYDGSGPAQEAAHVAARLAEKLGGNVTVLTVGQLVTAVGTAVTPTVNESAFLPLVEEGAQIVRALGADVDTRVLFGEPAQVLVDVAAREGYDMLVVGHRGLGGIKGLLLGSVAKKVATGARCPVMVVRGPAPEAIRRVLAAVDGSEHAERALEAAPALAKAFAARITRGARRLPASVSRRQGQPGWAQDEARTRTASGPGGSGKGTRDLRSDRGWL